MAGYQGKLLRVNLSNREISEEPPNEDACRKFLGGAGLATKYLYDEVKPGADPLGPDNELIFMTGPLTGTLSPSAGRYSVVAKSPLTGIWGQANSGGSWGADLKKAGFDGIIFQGIAPEPVYLVIQDGVAELQDASSLWGKSVPDTTQTVRAKHGDKCGVACIGIAGENQVLFATIMNDTYRAACRLR